MVDSSQPRSGAASKNLSSSSAPFPKRFRVVKDDDGHSYCIPADMLRKFERWVEREGSGPIDFNEYALGCHLSCYTFSDFREER